MKVLSRCSLLVVALVCAVMGVQAQHDGQGGPALLLKEGTQSPGRGTSSVLSTELTGPIFPPPFVYHFTPVGGVDASGRVGGKDWYFSGVDLSGRTQTYWGPMAGQVLLSLDGFSFTAAETLGFSGGSLAGGWVLWSGSSQYWLKSNGVGPFGIGTAFVLTVTDSVTGLPIPLVPATSVGLPASVGAVVPVTPGLHYRANLQFLVAGSPALDWFDLNADGLFGPVASSFTAGFYYVDYVPTPNSVAFGNVLVGATKADSIVVHNYGFGSRIISSAVSDDANFTVLPAADTIAALDSAKFYIDFTPSAGPKSGTILFSHNGVSSPDSVTVTGTGVMTIVIDKFVDIDGNASTLGDQSPHLWNLALYEDSVTGGTLVSQANSTQLEVDNLGAGTYIAVEADSGGAWVRLNGNGTRYDTIVLTSTPVTVDTFVNFRPNTLTVRKYRDNDGGMATTGDRHAKSWHLEIHSGSPGGPLVGSIDGTTLTVGGLGDGTYFAVEADSALWIHLGYVLNGTPVVSSANTASVNLSGGQSATIDFVNAPPIYSSAFRSFNPDSIALDVDNKGKVNKPVKRKAVRVQFTAAIANGTLGADGLHMEFSAAIDTGFPFYTVPPSTKVGDAKLKKWDFTFAGPIPVGDTAKIYGFGKIGKAIKVSKYFWRIGVVALASQKNPPISPNDPRNPMPNRVNALQDAYALGAFTATSGLLVGKNEIGPPDSSKKYGWVVHKKYGDVLKSLYVAKLVPHTHDGAPTGFNFVKKQSKLPKSKQNNKLFADIAALKLNIAASEKGITPPGFGSLIYDNGAGNPWNGKSINEMAHIADSLIMGYYAASVHQFVPQADYDSLHSALNDINNSFEGPLDTASFALTLEFTGTRPLYQVPYLHADSNLLPSQIRPVSGPIVELPAQYELYANYPNPFNPTTTIEFSLAEPSRVTLKVYDILGREVATLIDRGMYDDGSDEVTFDASRLASGVYIYRLVAEPVTDEENGLTGPPVTLVRKMILMK